jgi:hypothetical protein
MAERDPIPGVDFPAPGQPLPSALPVSQHSPHEREVITPGVLSCPTCEGNSAQIAYIKRLQDREAELEKAETDGMLAILTTRERLADADAAAPAIRKQERERVREALLTALSPAQTGDFKIKLSAVRAALDTLEDSDG